MEKKILKGCGVLFKASAGNILTCGEQRADGCNFKCKRCFKEYKDEKTSGKAQQEIRDMYYRIGMKEALSIIEEKKCKCKVLNFTNPEAGSYECKECGTIYYMKHFRRDDNE